jgi:alpha-glucosidase (family GH31 glycosyl hydrolase)
MMMAVAMNLSLSWNLGTVALRERARSGSSGWIGLALCALAAGPGAAQAQVERTVSAGTLRAVISADPWHVAFTDAAGKPVLAEAPGTGLGPTGTLGFQTALGWFHATKVVSEARDGGAYTATVATSDPTGRTLAVRIARDAAGVIALTATVQGSTGDVQQAGIGFTAWAGERFLGFGERSNAVDQRGNDVQDFVADGPYQPDENAFIAAFVPAAGFSTRSDATYFPVPWLLSSAGYGVLLDRDETSLWRLTTDQPDAWSVEVAAPAFALRVFAGPRPADVLRRFSARIGRQPRAAAPFYFGPWWQPPDNDKTDLEKLVKAGAAGSLANTYTHYLPCASQVGAEQAQLDRTKLFHDAGLAVTAYFNPMICTSHPRFQEAVDKDVLTKNAAGQPYEYRYTGSSQFFVGQLDFTAPGADTFFASLFGAAVAAGYDGWMEDFGEYTPSDAVSHDGTPGAAMHNRYVTLYHRSARRYARTAPRPLARFNRSGWTGTQPESQIVWGGDPTTDWGFDGLTSAVRQALSIGLSGISLWGSDIGGYFALNQRRLTPELLVRWIEFGFASGVMRTEANGFDLPDHGARPQITDKDILPVWRRYARLRTQLYPYLAAAERTYDRTGLPLMRHLALAWPGDPRATARDDEFLLGPALLVAPVLAPGAKQRTLYLPRGRWVDLWRSATLTSAVAPRLAKPRVLTGGADVTLPAPRAELPLLVRAGAVLELLPADVDTLTTYGNTPGLVHLRDRRSRVLLAFPVRPALRIGDGVRRTYRLQAALGTLRRPLVPCRVSVAGRALARRAWSYDAATTVLRATFRTRRARLVVAPCRG